MAANCSDHQRSLVILPAVLLVQVDAGLAHWLYELRLPGLHHKPQRGAAFAVQVVDVHAELAQHPDALRVPQGDHDVQEVLPSLQAHHELRRVEVQSGEDTGLRSRDGL